MHRRVVRSLVGPKLGCSRRVWIIVGAISEFLAIGFLVYATMSRNAVNLVTTQRLVVLLFGVTAFGTMHQSAEFILLGALTRRPGVPQYLGLGTR